MDKRSTRGRIQIHQASTILLFVGASLLAIRASNSTLLQRLSLIASKLAPTGGCLIDAKQSALLAYPMLAQLVGHGGV